jgi:hypothetical protein
VFGDSFTRTSNGELRRFALAVIAAHPTAYARLVGHEAMRGFTDNGGGIGPDIMINGRGDADFRGETARAEGGNKWFPGYTPPAAANGSALERYQHWVRVPRWLIGLFALAGLVGFVVGLVRRRGHPAEIFLLTGFGLASYIASVATVDFSERYIVCVYPLLAAGAALAIADLLPRRGPADESNAVADERTNEYA